MDFDQLKIAIEDYKKSVLKEEYLKFIKDENISLALRWEIFRLAPYYWKEIGRNLPSFKSEELLTNSEIFWYDDFCIERNQTVDCADWLTKAEAGLNSDYYKDKLTKNGWVLGVIDAFKREILSKNLGFFVYDW